MKIVRTYLVALLTTLFFVSTITARNVTFSGYVKDEKGQALQFVNIYLEEFAKGTTSDEKGGFSFSCDCGSSDSVSIRFSFIGYEERVVKLSSKGKSEIKGLKIVLQEKTEILDQFELNAIRKQEDATQLLDVSHLRSMPNASGSIETLISTQAGVSMNNELSSQYSVRGGNYDENSVYVNSVEVYRPLLIRSGEQEGLSFVNPDMVSSVSFSTGGFGVEYGDKMSSVLDIKYKDPTHFEGSVSLSLLGASAYIGHNTGKFSQMHGFRYKSSSYMLGSLQTDAEYNPNFMDYQTSLKYRFSDKWKLSFLGNISRNSYQFRPSSRETSFGTMMDVKHFYVNFDGQESDLFMTYFGSLSLSFDPTSRTHFELLTSDFHTSEEVSYDIQGIYWLSQAESGSVGNDISKGTNSYLEHARDRLKATVANISLLGSQKLTMNDIKWGMVYQREMIKDHIDEWELRDSSGYTMPLHEDALRMYSNLFSDENLETNRFSIYAQNTFTKVGEKGKFMFTGGLRYSYWSFNKESLLSPRLSFSWFPKKHPNWGLRLSGGRYYQNLFYKEIKRSTVDEYGNTTLELNRNIKAPRSYQVLIGSDYYFSLKNHPFKFTVEMYGKYIDRIIPYQVDNTQITYKGENCADGYAAGIDMKLFGEFVPGTDSWISLSFMDTRENIYGVTHGYIERPTNQLYNVSLFFQDYMPGFKKMKFNLKLIWADGLPFGPPNSEAYKSSFETSPYRRVDLGVAYHLRRGVDKVMDKRFFSWMKTLSFNLDFFNLLGIRNENSYYWVADASGQQYAVPNYLTGRRINFKLQIDF